MITNKTARRIASMYHFGQDSALYALVSSGAIIEGIHSELKESVRRACSKKELREIEKLQNYCYVKGYRGAVKNWHIIRF